ncbi:MAG: hypothetical protein J6A25_01800 [Lachnospiraceae bacterium]|nr:hypothetical protein [Lachnospiraceae bacterium]MBP3339063.1 hypothetical protein [Lachnospiraceae bacterium]
MIMLKTNNYVDIDFNQIQNVLFYVCIFALAFVIWNGRRREIKDISEVNRDKLKREPERIVDKEVIERIRKDRSIVIFFGFIFIIFTSKISRMFIEDRYRAEIEAGTYEDRIRIWGHLDRIEWNIVLVMAVLFIAWLLYDIKQVKDLNNKVIILAYIQSIFMNPRSKHKMAEIIYYDYKKNKFRLKTVAIGECENIYGRFMMTDILEIIAIEGVYTVKYVSLMGKYNPIE